MDRLHIAISEVPRQPVVTELLLTKQGKKAKQKYCWKSEAVAK